MSNFNSKIEKTIQAAAVLAHLEGGRIDRIRLLKLLYIADRESLAEHAVPIIGGRVVAMDNGPLHSNVYDLIKGTDFWPSEWSEHFANEGHVVILTKDPGRQELSAYEIEKLTAVSNARREIDSWEVAESTHEFQEWKDCRLPGSSRTIPLESLLGAVGFSPSEIEEIRHDAESHRRMDRMLSEN